MVQNSDLQLVFSSVLFWFPQWSLGCILSLIILSITRQYSERAPQASPAQRHGEHDLTNQQGQSEHQVCHRGRTDGGVVERRAKRETGNAKFIQKKCSEKLIKLENPFPSPVMRLIDCSNDVWCFTGLLWSTKVLLQNWRFYLIN